LFSSNATYVIGIDVQGDAKGFDVLGNVVDLKASASFELSDVYSALIIGENADDGGSSGTIMLHDNIFSQEYIIQNGSTNTNDMVLKSNERQLRGLHIVDTTSTSMKKPNGQVKNEAVGRCPLGYT
jgi:hypothetical protein